MKIDELVDKYIKLRDLKARLKAEFEEKVAPIDAAMDKVESVLLGALDNLGLESARGKDGTGTAYISMKTSASVADRDAYFAWVLDNPEERMIFIEARANKTAVEHYKDTNQELPPGVNWSATRTVNIRRGK